MDSAPEATNHLIFTCVTSLQCLAEPTYLNYKASARYKMQYLNYAAARRGVSVERINLLFYCEPLTLYSKLLTFQEEHDDISQVLSRYTHYFC